ncbi:MAG TPA: histidine phosphatase family protein [Candidatus Thermoplasmatota archaeon]|nr:histidine phosphatase family protein [Candidatus Thermoplasmatota archaeon]
MSRVFIVRHGEAEKAPGQSAEDLFSVAPDPPLSARGLAQAQRARDALAGEDVRAVVASPARRAMETARAVAQPHGLVVKPDPRLAELSLPGATYDEVLARILELPERLREDEALFARERARFAEAIREVAEVHPTSVVVAHGLSNRAFLCALRGIPLDEMLTIPMDHASVTRIDV